MGTDDEKMVEKVPSIAENVDEGRFLPVIGISYARANIHGKRLSKCSEKEGEESGIRFSGNPHCLGHEKTTGNSVIFTRNVTDDSQACS